MNDAIPLVIEFQKGSRIEEIALPADQIVSQESKGGKTSVGLGGMSFEGVSEDRLIFWRVIDVLPEELLTGGDDRLALDPAVVSKVLVQGNQVWPRA